MKTETKVFSSLPTVVSEWITADHGLTDEKGRKIGGRAVIESTTHGTISVRIQSLRDGIGYGAGRRPTFYRTPELARKAALRKLQLQANRYQRGADGNKLTDEDGIDGPFNRRMERAQ